jgi:hypothetical protein
MEKKLNTTNRNKPSDTSDIKRLILAIEGLSAKLEKSIELQEKLFIVEKKKLLNESKKNG